MPIQKFLSEMYWIIFLNDKCLDVHDFLREREVFFAETFEVD